MLMKTSSHEFLPHMPCKDRGQWIGQTTFGGLKDAAGATGEDICEMSNLSPGLWPAMHTRLPRRLYLGRRTQEAPHGLALHGTDVVLVQGDLLYSSASPLVAWERGSVTATDKTFVSFGDDLFIFPDKVRYSFTDDALHPLELDTGMLTGAVISGNSITVAGYNFASAGFRVGDCIRLDVQPSGASDLLNGYYKIKLVMAEYIRIEGNFMDSATTPARVRRLIPDLDGVCVAGERLVGYNGHQILACEAGNPYNWYVTDSAHPAAAPVTLTAGGDENFTACCVWQGYPVLFTPHSICRLMGLASGSSGLTPAAYLSESAAPGVAAGQGETLCEVDGALYYCADTGIYRYTGTWPQRLGGTWCHEQRGICAGTDGHAYLLYTKNTANVGRLNIYTPSCYGAPERWHTEDDVAVAFMLKKPFAPSDGSTPGCLMMLENGDLWMERTCLPALSAGFTDVMMGTVIQGAVEFGDERRFEMNGLRLRHVRIRAKGDASGTLTLKVTYDGQSEWQTLGSYTGDGNFKLYDFCGTPRLCHWYRLRLETTGTWQIDGIWRALEKGED